MGYFFKYNNNLYLFLYVVSDEDLNEDIKFPIDVNNFFNELTIRV